MNSFINVGHGWVRPIPNGTVARCGGPHICTACAKEMELLARAVKELYYWQVHGPDATNFTALFFVMFQKGSGGNRERLALGFPWEYEAWKQWNESPTQEEFFSKFGFGSKTSPTKTAE